MTVPNWLPTATLLVNLILLVYLSLQMRRIRRLWRDADQDRIEAKAKLLEAEAAMDRVGAFLAHLMQQHSFLHTPHSHDDDEVLH